MYYVATNSNKQKNLEKKIFSVAILKISDENVRIRSRITTRYPRIRFRTKISRIRNTG